MSNLPTAQWFTELITAGGGESAPPAPVEYMTRLNGVNSYIDIPTITIPAGTPFTILFLAPNAVAGQIICDKGSDDVNARPFIEFKSDGTIGHPSSMTALLDGQPIVRNVTPYPTDGLEHTIVATVGALSDLGVLGRLGSATALFYSNAILGLTVDNGSVWDFKFNEPWSADTPRIAYNSGSGADAEYINTVESDVEVRP